MTPLQRRLRRDLRDLAAAIEPSPAAWAAIQDRIDDKSDPDVVDLADPPQPPWRHRHRRVAAAVAATVTIGAGLGLATRTADVDTRAAAPPPAEWSIDASGPGQFRVDAFAPGFVVALPAGWEAGTACASSIGNNCRTAAGASPTDAWTARRPDPEQPVLNTAAVNVLRAASSSIEELLAEADDRGFILSEPVPVEVDGRPGVRVEVKSGALELFALRDGSGLVVAPAQEAWRITFVELDTSVVAIAEYAPAAPTDVRRLAQAESGQIVDSIDWQQP